MEFYSLHKTRDVCISVPVMDVHISGGSLVKVFWARYQCYTQNLNVTEIFRVVLSFLIPHFIGDYSICFRALKVDFVTIETSGISLQKNALSLPRPSFYQVSYRYRTKKTC